MKMKNFLNTLKQLYHTSALEGYTKEEIHFLKNKFGALPQVLEDYYDTAGKTKAFHFVQDHWISPQNFKQWSWLEKSDYFILLNENQGVCRAGIHRKDLSFSNPPVYTSYDDKTWQICTSTTKEFLMAALTYESVFTFDYQPEEFFTLTTEHLQLLQASLTKYPFQMQNWIDTKISFYSNACDNLVVVFTFSNGELQMLYGAASKSSYQKLLNVVKDIGEPL